MEYSSLQFAPFVSCVSPGFWSTLSKTKLEVMGLDEKPLKAVGTFANNTPPGVQQIFNLDWDSLKPSKDGLPWNTYAVQGKIFNVNTIDSFKSCDKAQFLKERCDAIWRKICDGSAVKNPGVLNDFSVLMFSDLKKYHYYYWFAFPSFAIPPEIVAQKVRINLVYSQEVCDKLAEKMATNCDQIGGLVFKDDDVNIATLEDALQSENGAVSVADPSSVDHPGWPIRNVLILIAKVNPHRLDKGFNIICIRKSLTNNRKIVVDNSLVLTVKTTDGKVVEMAGRC